MPDCLTLTSYLSARRRPGQQVALGALTDLYTREQIAASVMLPGMPSLSVAVDTRSRIEAVLERSRALATPGLVTVAQARMLDGEASPLTRPGGHEGDEAKLTVYLRRDEQAFQIPAFEAICDLLYRRRVDGATVLLGVAGSMLLTAVGPWEQIMPVLPDVRGLLRQPVLTVEPVRVCKRDGRFVGIPDRSPGTDERGRPLYQQLTVHTSAAARYGGQPIHRALARRLLSVGVTSVTTLSGVWGFHGHHVPHGVSRLHLARHTPAVTIVISAPERTPAAFAIIDELTIDRGLVISQPVAAARADVSAPR